MASSTILSYSWQFMRSLKNNLSPPIPHVKNLLRSHGLLRGYSRPRGRKAGKNYPRKIETIVSRRNDLIKPELSARISRQNLTAIRKVNKDSSSCVYPLPASQILNPRSLVNKLDESQSVLSSSNTDIALLSETWFSPSIPDQLQSIDGFTVFSKCRSSRRGGGVAIYVRDNIPSSPLDIPVPTELECSWIKARPHRLPRNVSGLAVCAVYCPPSSPHGELLVDHLVEAADSLRVKYPHIGILIGGDFNRVDVRRLCVSQNLHQLVNQPTRGQSTLDLVITNLNQYYLTSVISAPLGTSDHNIVTMQPKSSAKPKNRTLGHSSLRAFGQWITTHHWAKVYSAPTACETSRAMHTTLLAKIDQFFPLKITRLHHLDKPWLTSEIKALIRRRQQAFARNDTYGWKNLRNKVQTKIRHSKKVFYNSKVKSLKRDDAAQWHKEIKTMTNMSRPEAVINIDGFDPSDKRGIANEINKSRGSVIQSLPPIDATSLPSYLPLLPAPQVKPWDVYKKLLKVKPRKAAGPDGIPGKLIKEFACELSEPFTDILNTSLLEGSVPDEWKNAIVVPIPKTTPPSVEEVRPISLTSLLAKVAESFITTWAVSDILPGIDDQQFGCLKGRSTTHCLLDITNQLFKASDKPNTLCSLVSTDYSKAFDRVCHSVAICRLLQLGLRASLTRWRADFLTNRRQAVRYHGVVSDNITVTCGLPQGTLLGPLIFITYINSAASHAISQRWKFVDDLNMLEIRYPPTAPSYLQQDLSDLDKWSQESHMLLHPGKLKHFQLSTDDLVTVYISYIRPVTEYAAAVWHSGLPVVLSKRIEKVQKRALRIILGTHYKSYKRACDQLGLPSLWSRREKLTKDFAKSLVQSTQYRHLLPPSRGNISSRVTRTSHKLDTQPCRTARYS
ncbi:hypothetical protein Bbelb_431700 [Branchiostoma belcheri]|nr:hypothetical protein Bbelb_431700 [Branchiostoma belcheri]